jgi:hypothetical protein
MRSLIITTDTIDITATVMAEARHAGAGPIPVPTIRFTLKRPAIGAKGQSGPPALTGQPGFFVFTTRLMVANDRATT